MAIGELTSFDAVVRAMTEFDRLGRKGFLFEHGFGESTRYMVRHNGRLYDSKAIAGVAFGYEHPTRGVLPHEYFNGGSQTLRVLRRLGFEIVDLEADVAPPGRVFGEIAGQPPGSVYASRAEAAAAGVHKPMQAGISFSEREGADSIVVSGGYEDDEDFGSTIVYTGHGGNDPGTGRQVADQVLERGNFALAKNAEEGLPVRVVRGASGDSAHSPPSGYRYDGLFTVERFWRDRGRSGFWVWRYKLVQFIDPSVELEIESESDSPALGPEANSPAQRVATTVQRIVRSTRVGRGVKHLHEYRCQLCATRLDTPAGPYAEAAHVRPLGRPHDGPDHPSNVLRLCANCHVLFDSGALYVAGDGWVTNGVTDVRMGELRRVVGHQVDSAHLSYHRMSVAAQPS